MIMAKGKGKKEATDKVIQFESAKIMAQQVIAAMQSTESSEKSPAEENNVILVHEEQQLSISTDPNYDKDLTSSNLSPLPPPKPTTRENESLSQTSHRNSFSTPFSSSDLMANSPTYITLTTPKPRQRNLIPDHDPTLSPTKTTTSTPVNRVASARQLHFQPDISTGSTQELSSEINNAICLSYNCTQWQAEHGDADSVRPKCECEELREENSRLKATIEKLQLEQERSTMPEAPAAAVMCLESLTKYLRGIHTHANDEIVLVQSPQNHASESHIAHLNTMPKLKPMKMPQVSAVARPSNITTVKTVTLSSSHFEDGDGKQELCPGSGVYIPTIKLRQCHHKAGAEMKVLFHVLMDHFFTDEILAKSIAFGNRVVPSGKEVLNPKIVSAIKGYLLSAAKVFNVTPLDGAKLNKMFTNKCTTAQIKAKKKLMMAK
ncbi:Hypothetical predicted protein [Paramuricea clavata]|uniref:Uncharacterized protein n=1 Tax=Paramuricea clavata TaxID=317549 RepID=A0A7D9EX35_PARCT|nr:Hypothetical predicted protein [Paramuricea clavata]